MNDYSRLLENYLNFQECILTDIKWKNQGLIIDLLFDYIWDKNQNLLETPIKIVIRLYLVQELCINFNLNTYMVQNPEEIDWGINEISQMKVLNEFHEMEKYKKYPVEFHKLIISWESGRRIEVVFSVLEIFKDYSINN